MTGPARRRWWLLVWRDATTGIPLIFGALSCLLAVGLGLAAAHPEDRQWADRFNLAFLICAFTGPLGFAAAAAHTGSLYRQGLLDLAATSRRGRYAFARVAAGASLAWALLTVALTTGVVLLAAVPPRPPLTPAMLLLPAAAVALMIGCSLAGSVTGTRHPSTLVPAVGAAAVFAWLYGGTLLPGAANLISPVDSGSFYEPFTQPNGGLYGGLALILVGAAAVTWALLQNRRSLVWSAASAAAVVVAAGGVLIATSSFERVVALPPPARSACATNSTVTVCLWPGMADQLPTVLAAATTVTDHLGPYLQVPATFVQEGLNPQPGALTFRTSTSDVDPESNQQRMVDALLPECTSGALDNPARDKLVDWARYRLGAAFSQYDTEAAALAALPRALQRRWVEDQLDRARRC